MNEYRADDEDEKVSYIMITVGKNDGSRHDDDDDDDDIMIR